jgi:hypothetical protein
VLAAKSPVISSADNVIESFIWRPSRYLVVRFMDGLHFCGLHPQIPTVHNFRTFAEATVYARGGLCKMRQTNLEGSPQRISGSVAVLTDLGLPSGLGKAYHRLR